MAIERSAPCSRRRSEPGHACRAVRRDLVAGLAGHLADQRALSLGSSTHIRRSCRADTRCQPRVRSKCSRVHTRRTRPSRSAGRRIRAGRSRSGTASRRRRCVGVSTACRAHAAGDAPLAALSQVAVIPTGQTPDGLADRHAGREADGRALAVDQTSSRPGCRRT